MATRRNKTANMTRADAPKLRIKKNDLVYVLAGKDRGATGKVLVVDLIRKRATVEGVNIVKKHRKVSKAAGGGGGITDMPAPIHMSNLVVVCPHCKAHTKPTKQTVEKTRDGKTRRYHVRKCRKCGEQLDQI